MNSSQALAQAREDFKKTPNSVIGWLLLASYLYYCRYTSLFEDSYYDKMCSYALKHYDELEHRLKYLLTKDMLSAGTAYNLRYEDYPKGFINHAEYLMRKGETL